MPARTGIFDINRADKEIIMSRLELRHYVVLSHSAAFSLCRRSSSPIALKYLILISIDSGSLLQMAFNFFEPRVLLLLKLVVLPVVQFAETT